LSSTVRIRDKEATIKQLEFPKDTLDKLQQLVSARSLLVEFHLAAFVGVFLRMRLSTMLKMLLELRDTVKNVSTLSMQEKQFYNY
jgi:hypothetical protein